MAGKTGLPQTAEDLSSILSDFIRAAVEWGVLFGKIGLTVSGSLRLPEHVPQRSAILLMCKENIYECNLLGVGEIV